MISHILGALEPERLAGGDAGHAQLLYDRFVLPSRKTQTQLQPLCLR